MVVFKLFARMAHRSEAILHRLVFPAICKDATRSNDNSYRGRDEGQKYRKQCAPGKRDLAKRLSARSPYSATEQLKNPSAGEANVGHDPVDDDGKYGE